MGNSKMDAFIHKAKLIHGDKYDYSKVEYVNNHTKICIICPEHGAFWQIPKSHLMGQGCRLCYNQRTKERLHKTTEQFIGESKLIHGDKYDYSKVNYTGCYDKVCIICPKHGEFWQKPQHHLQGCGCTKCCYIENGLKSRVTLETFIERANEVHEYKYDYSKVEYINTHTKVCIICPEHGEFWQTPVNHLQGHPCPACSNRKRMTMKEFVEQANKIHNNKYDYSNITYVNNHTKVCIICPEHGEFWETPYRHLLSHGCTMCSGYRSLSIDEFIQKAKGVHGSRYDYSKVEYVNNSTKVCIICPEHGEFWQTPGNHLHGHGCAKCMAEQNKINNMHTATDFIRKAIEIHNDRYDYSLVEYKGSHEKIQIICPIHGVFWQDACGHLNGHGCPKCNKSKLEIEIENIYPNFIQQKNLIG